MKRKPFQWLSLFLLVAMMSSSAKTHANRFGDHCIYPGLLILLRELPRAEYISPLRGVHVRNRNRWRNRDYPGFVLRPDVICLNKAGPVFLLSEAVLRTDETFLL
jgi:hypothetical protein